MALVKAQANQSTTEMARSIIDALDTFRHPRPAEDDATLVVIKITG